MADDEGRAAHKDKSRYVKLDLVHCYGAIFSKGIRDCLYFLDEQVQKILYPIGKYIAVKSLEPMNDQFDMNFIKLPKQVEQVIAMAISFDKSKIAVSLKVKGEIYPQVTIYNIKGNKADNKTQSIVYNETKSDSFVSLCFSYDKDARYIAMVTDEKDCQVVFWDLSKNKLVNMTPMTNPVTKICVYPKDPHTVSISGVEIFKIFRVHESPVRNPSDVLKLNQKQNFTDHCWIDDDRVVVGTDQGSLYIIKKAEHKYELKQEIKRAFADMGIGVTVIKCFSKGFVCGSEFGNFALWLKIEENIDTESGEPDTFILHNIWDAKGKACAISLDITSKEDQILVGFKSNCIAVFDMNKVLVTGDGVQSRKYNKMLGRDENKLKVRMEYIYGGFHSAPITGIDVCIQRPLIVTISREDSTIRIWNYITFKSE